LSSSKKIRLSIAIAGANALPSAFVVFRGFEESIQKAYHLGLDGIELALKNAEEIDPAKLDQWLNATGLTVSCVSTGQVYADAGLMFTDEDEGKRLIVTKKFKEIIDLAADFGQLVNIGRVRGRLGEHPRKSKEFFKRVVTEICEFADRREVTLILEPVNRYEIDFINSVVEGVSVLRELDIPNLKLMPDTFHMNIEDSGIADTLSDNIEDIAYIHFADSNRLAPGQGHIDFDSIFRSLQSVDYRGWVSLEILPKPSPDIAARQAADFLMPRIENYNQNQ
jgi:sugar phosphate isomerase/epimerase